MTPLRPVLFACALVLACGGTDEDVPDEGVYSPERCEGIRDDIGAALQDNVNKGVLLGSATPCGPDSLVHSSDAFDPRAEPQEIESVRNIFRDACGEYEAHCVTEMPDGT